MVMGENTRSLKRIKRRESRHSREERLCLGDGVKFANVKELELRVEVATDIHLVADGKVEIDDENLPCQASMRGSREG